MEETNLEELNAEQTDRLANELSEFSLYLARNKPTAAAAKREIESKIQDLPPNLRIPFEELAGQSLWLEEQFSRTQPLASATAESAPAKMPAVQGRLFGRLPALAVSGLSLFVLLTLGFLTISNMEEKSKLIAKEQKLSELNDKLATQYWAATRPDSEKKGFLPKEPRPENPEKTLAIVAQQQAQAQSMPMDENDLLKEKFALLPVNETID